MKKILLIDDDAAFRDNAADILELSGYAVLQAQNAKEGVQIAVTQQPDLVICDIVMPMTDGYAVLHALQREKVTAGIPFIFLTARSEKEEWRRAMAQGADDYLIKPLEGIDLLKAVETCLNKRASRVRPGAGSAAADGGDADGGAGEDQFIDELKQRTIHPYKKKSFLYLEGQRPNFVYFILSGKVKTYRSDPEGKELITGLWQGGDFLGYPALLEGKNFYDNAQVMEDAEIVPIARQEFVQWMEQVPSIGRRFIRLLSRYAAEKNAGLLNLAYNSLRKRVANGLLQLIGLSRSNNTGDTAVAISRENLANIVGCATESLTRTLSDFRAERLIDIRGGRIYILNEEKLKNLIN